MNEWMDGWIEDLLELEEAIGHDGDTWQKHPKLLEQH